ncbi:MAG: hypothetical protein OEV44_01640 [Spirochaetota bacterium]|nr:hypothetical protein [Spirochaetota bacterium]
MNEDLENSGNSFTNWFSDNQLAARFGIIFAGVAIFLIIIVGIFSGVGFWRIILRIFIGGIIFLGFGIGIGILLQKFVPELLSKKSESSNNDKSIGENVDYVAGDSTEENNTEYLESFQQNQDNSDPKLKKLDKKSKEFNIPNDPKMLADAVRTVMKRDE